MQNNQHYVCHKNHQTLQIIHMIFQTLSDHRWSSHYIMWQWEERNSSVPPKFYNMRSLRCECHYLEAARNGYISCLSTLACLAGWTLHGSNCYKLGTDSVTFDNAEKACATSSGGHITSITSAEENAFVADFAKYVIMTTCLSTLMKDNIKQYS